MATYQDKIGTSKNNRPRRWHTLEDEQMLVAAIHANVTRLMDRNVRHSYARWRRLLLDEAANAEEHKYLGLQMGRRARHNIVRNAVESIVAEHAKDLARPMIVPVGGEWRLQRKCKVMQRAIDGDWQRVDADAMREAQIHDACTYGEGHIRIRPCYDRVVWNRVRPWCMLSEPRQDQAGRLLDRYEISTVDVDVLIDEYATDEDGKTDKKLAELIMQSDTAQGKLLDHTVDVEDYLILVMEAWRLPTTPGGEGRYVVCTSKAVLIDKPWKADFFPHSTMVYSRDPESTVTGRGLPERMAGQQYEQNSISETISDNARLLAGCKVVIYNSAKINEEELTNESGAVVNCDGPPGSVQILAHSGNAIDLVQNARVDRQEMLSDQGINPLSASGQVPNNIESGKHQQLYRDDVRNRHAMLGRQCERATVQCCRLHMFAWEQIVEDGEKPYIRAKKRRRSSLEVLNYNDIKLSSEYLDVQVFPVSNLSNVPSGRMSEIEMMQNAQWIGPMEARRLMGLPDIEEANDLAMAGQDLALDLIEQALDVTPEQYAEGVRVVCTRVCDKMFLVERGWQMHAKEQLDGATDEDLQALRDLLGSADTQLKQEAEQAQMAAANAAPPVPPAAAPPPQPTGPVGVVQ